jgi:hypothetical protein
MHAFVLRVSVTTKHVAVKIASGVHNAGLLNRS